MNEPVVVYPPNRPMDRIIAPSKTPVLYDYLAFIDTNNRGKLYLFKIYKSGLILFLKVK